MIKANNGFVVLTMCIAALGCGGPPTPGESCSASESASCSAPSIMMKCDKGTWKALQCRGPRACSSAGNAVVCDQTLAFAGDACDSSGEGGGACSQDGKAALTCTGGAYVKQADCLTCNITTTNQVDCKQPCGPQSCGGCCFNGACQPGNAPNACGKGGEECAACQTNYTCGSGVCTGCETNLECPGAEEVCVANQCVSAYGRTFQVLLGAMELPTSNNGADWDFGGGAPDPFVLFQKNGQTVCTSITKNDTFTPTWNGVLCEIILDQNTTTIAFDMYDEDTSAHDPVEKIATDSAATTIQFVKGYGFAGVPAGGRVKWDVGVFPKQ